MKLGPVTKFDKRNKTTSKNFEDDVMSGNYNVIFIFLIYDEFRMIREPSIKHIFSFYLTKTQNKTKMSLSQLSHDRFE